MKVKYDIPVTLFDYRTSDNPLYSLAKLKIFYVGMTPDNRLFTKEFSDELLKTLPYVPVVGYFDKESDDFKGHHENQYIYGIVPENTEIEFVEEDEKEYAVCDVILYTGRKDETGEIAEKIVGKSHSLELNPDDTTYDLVESEEGKLQYIEFKTGSLLGLSVLGDEEQPAFTGSEFFKAQKDFSEIFEGFKTEWEKFNDESKNKRGNEEMKFDLLESQKLFMEKAYDEKMEAIAALVSERFEYFSIIQMFDDKVVVVTLNEETWAYEYYRISYSSDEDSLSLGEMEVVYPRYLTESEVNEWEGQDDEFSLEETGESNDTSETDNNEQEEEFTENETETEEDDDTSETDFEEDSETEEQQEEAVENNEEEEFVTTEDNEDEQEEEEEEEQHEESKEFNSTSLTNSEREELEAFRRERKIGLIDSFEGDLEEDYLEEMRNRVDEFTHDDLETELSKKFTAVKKAEKQKDRKLINPVMYQKNKSINSSVKDLINRYKDQE